MKESDKNQLRDLVSKALKGDSIALREAQELYCRLCNDEESGYTPGKGPLVEFGAGLLLVSGKPIEAFIALEGLDSPEASVFRATALHMMGAGEAAQKELPKKPISDALSAEEWQKTREELAETPQHLASKHYDAQTPSITVPYTVDASDHSVPSDIVDEFERLLGDLPNTADMESKP